MRIGLDARELQGRATGVGRYLRRLLEAWPAAPGDSIVAYFNGPAPAALPKSPARLEPRGLGARPVRGLAWQELRLPYEASRARVRLARALRAAADDDGATLELRAALSGFEHLGAVRDAGEVAGLLGMPDALPDGLTPRDAEVLRLVASGKTNRDIAVELVISEHTVGRHLQNLYAKVGVSSRAAATAYAFEHGLT